MMSHRIKNCIEPALFSLVLMCGLLLFMTPPMLGETPLFTRFSMYGKAGMFLCVLVCFLLRLIKDKCFDGFIGLFSLFSFSVVLGFLSQGGSLSLTVWNNAAVPVTVVMLLYLSLKADFRLSVRAIYILYLAFAFINIYTVCTATEAERVHSFELFFYGNRNTHIYFYLIPLFTGYYGLKKGILKSRSLYAVLYVCVLFSVILTKGLTALIVSLLWGGFLLLNSFLELCAVFGFRFNLLTQGTLFTVFQLYNGENNSFIRSFLKFAGKNENVSSRAPLWKLARAEICKAPLFGHGAAEMEQLLHGMPHPHNIYLHMAYNRGLTGVFLFLCILFLLHRAADTVKDRSIRGLMGFFIFVVMLSGQFDEYNTVFYAFYGGLLYYLAAFGEKSNE